jgi:arginine N-succinyltransferase
MFVIRDVGPSDLDDLVLVSRHLDSVNLPDDRATLAEIIQISEDSFAKRLPVPERRFVFVLVDEQETAPKVVGVSMIFAQHGSRRSPHVYFDVLEDERYSETLDRHFTHRLLRIGYSFRGLTEIGGLALLPAMRARPERLGSLLSAVRFLFMARHRSVFLDDVVSELMPPLESDGTSLLWEHLGRHFTGLSYQEADRLSRKNKEFIRTLFPQEPIYVSLLPAHVQAMVGQVGPHTKGVERFLRRIGFAYAHRIDPFDGGPHFHARLDDIQLVRNTRVVEAVPGPRELSLALGDLPAFRLVAVERDEPPRFLAAVVAGNEAELVGDKLLLPAAVRERLGLAAGAHVATLTPVV